jgi:circadian clock protein KaiC
VTTIVTGERGGETTLTRHGLEEYVSDCVIYVDHRMTEQVATRRLRVLKYRGSLHGTNEYPFMITNTGVSVLPITSVHLEHTVSNERVSSGIPELDRMMGGRGFYKGSSIMITGTAGTGKSSIAASFSKAACQRGERVLYLAFEESRDQIIRNMRSIGIDLEPFVKKGLLRFRASRPTLYGLEMHLATISDLLQKFKPRAVVIDPISNLISVGSENEVRSALIRLIDYLKSQHVTTLFTNLTHPGALESTDVAISSLIDTWLLIRDLEINGERNRTLYILKSRGMKHSNQVREFLLTDKGIDLVDVYAGADVVLTGTARVSQEEKEKADELVRKQEITRLENDLRRRQRILESQMEELRARSEAESEQLKTSIETARLREETLQADRRRMSVIREGQRKGTGARPGGGKR